MRILMLVKKMLNIVEILKQYGNVGLAIYSKLKNSEIKKIFFFENCILKLIDCYLDASLISSEERKIDIVDYSSLIQYSLPNLGKIKEIINNKVYNQKVNTH